MESGALDLKSEREKRNIPLDKIAAETKISLRYLQYIEEERFNDLPGGVYNRAFIKAYCECIDFDPHDVLERYEGLMALAQSDKNSKSSTHLSQPDTFSISAPLLLWIIILLVAIIGIYLGRGWISEIFSPYFSGTTNATEIHSTPVERPYVEDDPHVATHSRESEPESFDAIADLSSEDESALALESSAGDSFSEDLIPQLARPSLEISDASLRIEIKATELCWIAIDIDGISSTKKLMEPGETEFFIADNRIGMLIGNAGGIIMRINNNPTKPLGIAGEVIRMNIDPLNIQQFIDPNES